MLKDQAEQYLNKTIFWVTGMTIEKHFITDIRIVSERALSYALVSRTNGKQIFYDDDVFVNHLDALVHLSNKIKETLKFDAYELNEIGQRQKQHQRLLEHTLGEMGQLQYNAALQAANLEAKNAT